MTKQSSGTLRVIGISVAIGYCASRAMDLATDWYSEHQSEASKQREEEIASEVYEDIVLPEARTPAPAQKELADGRRLAGWPVGRLLLYYVHAQ